MKPLKMLLQNKEYIYLVIAAVIAIAAIIVYVRRRRKERPEPNEIPDNNIGVLGFVGTVSDNYPDITGTPGTANFKLSEFKCKDGTPVPAMYWGNLQILMNNLQALRDYLGVPVSINSGYRTVDHNKTVGGAKGSAHLTAKAADIVAKGKTPRQVNDAIKYLISTGEMQDGGLSLYPTFNHYDVGTARRW